MKNEYEDIEQLERYQKGECTSEEKKEVEDRLANDEAFRGLYDDMELMVLGLKRTSGGSSIEDKIELLRKTVELNEEREVINLKSWFTKTRINLSIAAVISLLIASMFLFNNVGNNSPESLFQDYFQPYENLNSALRGNEQEIDNITRAYLAYERGEFENAILLFGNIDSITENRTTHQFYLGNAYLGIGEGKNAIPLFLEVSRSTSILADTAKWYLALSHLQNRDTEKAKKILIEIQNSRNDYSSQSKELLEKLN